jgi:hypothetical protein
MQTNVVNGLSLFKHNKVQITGVPKLKYIPSKEAVELYTKYHTELNGSHDNRDQSYINIDKVLKIGYSYTELLTALENYRKACKGITTGKRSAFIYACQNFYSPQQFKFVSYLPEHNTPDVTYKEGTENNLPTDIVVIEERF